MPMPTRPSDYLTLIAVFVPLFSKRVWAEAQILLVGSILASGKRTVTAVLRVTPHLPVGAAFYRT
jgi:hypothetical protein